MTHISWALAPLFLALPASAQVGPNVAELAKELANSGAANATLNSKFKYRIFDGDLPDAKDQDSFTTTLQPVFPFILLNGNNLIFMPAVRYVFVQPAFDAGDGDFDTEIAFGDIAYDLLYAGTRSGMKLGAGIFGVVPTGTDISSDDRLLGPNAIAVKTEDWGVWGVFPFHNEKNGGSGADVSITSRRYVVFYCLGDGWQIGIGPTVTYGWEADHDDAWTVPFGVQVAQTTAIGNQLVKLNAGIEKNVAAPDAFASDWKSTYTFSPVISNPFQRNPPASEVDAATRAAVLAPIW